MGDPRRPIEEIAAEEIAADEARSRDWVSPKLVAAVPTPASTGLAWVTRQFWALVAFLLVGLAACTAWIVFGQGLGERPSPSPSAPPIADASGTPLASELPTPTPGATATAAPTAPPQVTASPTAASGPVSFVEHDKTGDGETDSGVPTPDDGVVDIVDVQVAVLPDGSIEVLISDAAPLPADHDPDVSRAKQVFAGRMENGQPVPLALWYWQLHGREVTMGRLDPDTGATLTSQAVITHRETVGIFTFHIPADEVPEGTQWLWVYEFHKPTPDDERRRDDFGPIVLPTNQ